MTIALAHAKSATAAAARAAARDTSSDDAASDEALIKRIAGGDQLAMRTFKKTTKENVRLDSV